MKVSESPIHLEYLLDASVDKVWTALVEIDQMKEWYFNNIPDFKPQVGFKTEFVVENEGRTFTHQWEILKVEPENLITYHWFYPEYPGDANLTFKLSPSGHWTKVEVIMDILEDYPDDIPEFKRESCEGGWNYFIGESLRAYLAKA